MSHSHFAAPPQIDRSRRQSIPLASEVQSSEEKDWPFILHLNMLPASRASSPTPVYLSWRCNQCPERSTKGGHILGRVDTYTHICRVPPRVKYVGVRSLTKAYDFYDHARLLLSTRVLFQKHFHRWRLRTSLTIWMIFLLGWSSVVAAMEEMLYWEG